MIAMKQLCASRHVLLSGGYRQLGVISFIVGEDSGHPLRDRTHHSLSRLVLGVIAERHQSTREGYTNLCDGQQTAQQPPR